MSLTYIMNIYLRADMKHIPTHVGLKDARARPPPLPEQRIRPVVQLAQAAFAQANLCDLALSSCMKKEYNVSFYFSISLTLRLLLVKKIYLAGKCFSRNLELSLTGDSVFRVQERKRGRKLDRRQTSLVLCPGSSVWLWINLCLWPQSSHL